MSEWRPIETAPLYETVLVYGKEIGWPDTYIGAGRGVRDFGGVSWVRPDGDHVEATHWMPLPEPPEET